MLTQIRHNGAISIASGSMINGVQAACHNQPPIDHVTDLYLMRPLCLNILFASFKVLHCQKSLSYTDKYVGNSIFTSIVYHLFTLSNCVLIERESILIRTAERKHEHVGKSEGAFSFPIRRGGGCLQSQGRFQD